MSNARRWITRIIGLGERTATGSPPAGRHAGGGEERGGDPDHRSDGWREYAEDEADDDGYVDVDVRWRDASTPVGAKVPTREELGRVADPLVDLFKGRGRSGGYYWHGGAKRFLELAELLVDLRVEEAPRVPFQAYWSTYDDMGVAQRRWYFWWRQEAREGRYLDTDPSYVFVHVYELIHLVGAVDASDAVDQLERLEERYAGGPSGVRHYLTPWIEDLARVHGLDDRLAARWRREFDRSTEGSYTPRVLDHHVGRGFLRMPLGVIGMLSGYKLESSFARAGNAHLQELFTRLALEAVDAGLRQRTGRGLLEHFGPQGERRRQRQAFQGAVYAGPPVVVDYDWFPHYRDAVKLRERLHGVVKYVDKRLRDEVGFKHVLTKVEISKTDAAIVDRVIAEQLPAYLRRVGPAKTGKEKAAPPPPEAVVVTVDAGRVRALMEESDETRGMLIEGMGAADEAEVTIHVTRGGRLEPTAEPPPPPAEATGEPTSSGFTTVHLAAVRALLMPEGGEAVLRRVADGAGVLPEVLLDGVNEAALDVFGDQVVDLSGPAPRVYAEYEAEVRALVEAADAAG